MQTSEIFDALLAKLKAGGTASLLLGLGLLDVCQRSGACAPSMAETTDNWINSGYLQVPPGTRTVTSAGRI